MLRIIDLCASRGVTKLKFGDVEVEFGTQPPTLPYYTATNQGTEAQGYPQNPLSTPAPLASEQKPDTSLAMFDQELLEDMRRAQLLIDDPLLYEQEMIDEHVRRGPHATDEDRRAEPASYRS